ncbi:MAG: ParD-like family protein [Methylobacter sp.]
MSITSSIRINQDLYEQAKQDAALEHRSIAGQIEFWARVGRAALDNPDLPVNFVAESLVSLAEPHENLQPFVPRSHHP